MLLIIIYRKTFLEIVKSTGVHPSTICREIQRNQDKTTHEYHYAFADSIASKS